MIELALTLLIIGTGLGFWLGDIRANRKWLRETMDRRVIASIRH